MSAVSQSVRRTRIEGYPARNPLFENLIGFLNALFIFGLFVDGWAHNHGKVDTSFFTPYHAVMYGSFALLGAALVGMQFYNVSRGYTFSKALPRGYLTALVGVLVFGFAGGADMLWHLAFGIETDIEALISPSHLLLLVGYLIILSGLIQAAWLRQDDSSWSGLWQTVVAWAGVLSVLMFIMQYLYIINSTRPLVGLRPSNDQEQDVMAAARFFISSLVFLGVALMAQRRWRLPFGAMTFIYGISGLLMGWMQVRVNQGQDFAVVFALSVLPPIIAGLVTDLVIWWLKPSPTSRLWALYVIGGVVPLALSLSFMASIHIFGLLFSRRGLWWKIHMWLGIPVMAMILGVLLSLLVFPPDVPQEQPR